MRRGESRACGPSVVEGECSRTLPSGCPTAFPVWVVRVRPDSESSGNPVAGLGEMLVCTRWQPNLVDTVSFRPAPLLLSRILF